MFAIDKFRNIWHYIDVKANKLYISDLDGTLLGNDARLSDYALENLTSLIESGLNFTIASARSLTSIREIIRGLPVRLPVIEINGALISDLQTGKHHTINTIHKNTVENIFTHITDHGCMPFISSFDGNKDNLYYEKVVNEGMRWFLGDDTEDHVKRVRRIGNIAESFDEQVVCITVIDRFEVMQKLSDKIKSEFPSQLENHFFANPYNEQWHWLTIHDKRANKAIAVKQLANELGYGLEDVVVFGDNLNDVQMMQLNRDGAHSVAVDNATDEVKLFASEIVDSNENDGVVKYLLKGVRL